MNLCKTLINNEIESYSWDFLAQRKNLRSKSDKFISLLRNKISNNYEN